MELVLGPLALGDVARGDDDAPHRRVVEQVVADGLDVAPPTVGMAHAELHGLGEPRLGDVAQEDLGDTRGVFGVHELEDVVAFPESPGIAEHALAGGTRVDDVTLGVEHGDDVGRVLEEGEEPLFTETERPVRLGQEAVVLLRKARVNSDRKSVRTYSALAAAGTPSSHSTAGASAHSRSRS